MKIAIIGSGSTYTPELIEGLINRRTELPLHELALMDIDENKLHIVGNLAKRMVEHEKLGCKVVITENLETALEGASFVFVQIRVGKLPARVLDEKIPLKYNLIGQETTGIGGFFKALRTIPVLMDIAEKMSRLCPDAFMINFSNPSGICAQALLTHTKVKMMGLCNVPIGMIDEPQKALGISGAEMDYVGLNHLSFVTGIRLDGKDLLREAVGGDAELLAKLDGQQGFDQEVIRFARAIPNGYVNYFYKPRAALKKLLEQTQSRGEVCMEIEKELLEMYQDTGLYIKPPQLSKRGGAMYSTVACSLADSIYNDRQDKHVVNTLNRGALPFLADDDVVETTCIVGKNGAVPVPVVLNDNPHVVNLIRTVKTYERYAVVAALSGSRIDALRALSANPLITDIEAGAACFDEMLEAHKVYLSNFF